MSGHLYVPAGSLGLEGFLYKGHTYTYFGLFPSMLRIPIFLFTHSLDGKLTGCSLFFTRLASDRDVHLDAHLEDPGHGARGGVDGPS